MRKTLFAGLTVLEPDDSLLDDGGAFGGRDREIIDRLLRLGAKTHRHDGSPGLGDPVSEMGASAIGSAGSLPADVQLSISYTLEDDALGETLIAPPVMISTPPPIEPPMFALQVEADHSAGNLLTETYYYAYSYVDGEGGETPISPVESGKRQPGFPNGRMLISGLTNGMVEAGATGWRLYRAVGGGNLHLLTEGDGDTYIDDGTDSVDCDIAPLREAINSTNGANSVLLALPSADAFVDEASFINVYISEDGDFAERDILLDSYPVSSAGEHVLLPTLDLIEGRPPDANMSIGGANLIDPDTELLEWTWKRPVDAVAQLGSGAKGDVRLVHEAGSLYYLPEDGATWEDWALLIAGEGGASFDFIEGVGDLIVGSAEGAVDRLPPGADDEVLTRDSSQPLGVKWAPAASAVGGGVDSIEDDLNQVADATTIKFTASAGASVGVSDEGAGVALITLAASGIQGPQGEQGEQGEPGDLDSSIFSEKGELLGASAVAGPTPVPAPESDGLVLTASASEQTGVFWAEPTASGETALPSRDIASATTGSIADDVTEDLALALAKSFRLMVVETDRPARVRLYATEADRTADAARPIGTDPTGDHGVILDLVTTPSDLSWRLSPQVDGSNLEALPSGEIPAAITNLSGSTDTVTVTLTYLPTEA